jgi:uncharacterized protein YkwD
MDAEPEISRASNRWVRLSMAGFAALVLLSVAVPALTPPADADTLEAEIHSEINDRRQANGVDTLSHNDEMSNYAASYSVRMVEGDFFAHTPPSGPPKQRVLCDATGENLFELPETGGDESEMAEEIVDGWMQSDAHRRNILDPRWRAEGIGVHVAGRTVVTQRFCG